MNIKIEAKKRELGKKSDLNKLRAAGMIPAVIYGSGQTGTKISLEKISFMKAYRQSIGGVAFYEIDVEGETFNAIIKDKQIHPTSREIMHIDFLKLYSDKEISVMVPVRVTGESKGVKAGGNLDVIYHKVEVTCLPKDVPEEIVIDVTEIGLGKSLHLKDLDLPETFKLSVPETATFVSVKVPRGVTVTEEEEEVAE